MLKGILFDLDGVITDTADYHFIAWKELAETIGIKISRDFNEQLKGVSREESLNRILEHGNLKNSFTDKEKEELMNKKNNNYIQLISQVTPEDFLTGIKPLLNDLKRKQMKLALASASKNAPLIIQKLGISNVFDVIVDPSILEFGKPHPEIFLKATKALNLNVSEVIGIEDAAEGIEALNQANIFSIGVGSTVHLHHADLVVPDTSYLTLDFILN